MSDLHLLPYGMIKSLLKRKTRFIPIYFRGIQCKTSIPIVHIESPPPIPCQEHIRQYAGHFKERINQLGITPAIIRYKLWCLHSLVIRSACQSLDVSFLPVPKEIQDENGMMVQEAWGLDATHANSWYGDKVIHQLINFIPQLADRK